MLRRTILVAFSVLALAIWAAPSAFASDDAHEGTLVAVADGKLTMTATGSKEDRKSVV